MTFDNIKRNSIWTHKDGDQYIILEKTTKMIGTYNHGLIVYTPIVQQGEKIQPKNIFMRTYNHFMNSFTPNEEIQMENKNNELYESVADKLILANDKLNEKRETYVGIMDNIKNNMSLESSDDLPVDEETHEEESPKKIFLSLDFFIKTFRDTIKPLFYAKDSDEDIEYDTIVCITRGGMVPASVLAYELNIKNIINIKASSYTTDNQQEALKLSKFSKKDIKQLRKSKGILVVDDIIDTGVTMDRVTEYLIDILGPEESYNKVTPFSVVNKRKNYTDYFNVFTMIDDPRWIVFEWDNNEG